MYVCRWLGSIVLALCLLCGVAAAQYIGSNRPVGQATLIAYVDSLRGEMADTSARTVGDSLLAVWAAIAAGDSLVGQLLDSLATASAAADSTLEADKIARSYYKAGDNVTITTHGTPGDSATISSTGGGGGSGLTPVPLPQSLTGMAARNVSQIFRRDQYGLWSDSSLWEAGAAGYDLVHVKTDTLGLSVTATALLGGAHFSLATADTVNLAQFPDGSASDTDDYICYSLYLDSTSYNNLPAGGFNDYLGYAAWPTNTKHEIAYSKAALAPGWNYLKTAKSAWGNPSSSWTIHYFHTSINGSPGGSVTWAIDNLQLIRRDSTDARPMALWQTGVTPWAETTTSAVTIYDGGIQSMVAGDYVASTSMALDTVSGRTIPAQTDSTIMIERASGDISLEARGGTLLRMMCSGGTSDSVSYPYAAWDTLQWSLVRAGSGVFTARVRVNAGADSLLSGIYSGSGATTRIRLLEGDRLLDLPGLISNYARLAVGNLFYYFTADSITAQ